MKELSLEEKAKHYDEAIKRARMINNGEDVDIEASTSICEYIFPELKESEDERIRGAIMHFISHTPTVPKGIINKEQMLAWLEKQCEQKPYGQRKKCSDCQFNYAGECKGSCQMKRDEQKTADKVEPKFHEGDWIVFNGLTLLVNEVAQGYYKTVSIGGVYNSYDWDIDNVARLWTIADAKDGDILSNGKMIVIFKHFEEPSYKQHIVAYIGLDISGNIRITDDTWCLGFDKAKPATKEQRDFLSQKMREEGYVWDIYKKELNKIEQNNTDKCIEAEAEELTKETHDEKHNLTEFEYGLLDVCRGWIGEEIGWKEYIKDNANVLLDIAIKKFNSVQDAVFEQKPAEWSEEDEKMLRSLHNLIYVVRDCNCDSMNKKELSDWLQSLKERNILETIVMKENELKKEINLYLMRNPVVNHKEKSLNGYIKNVAKHFFELGLKAK